MISFDEMDTLESKRRQSYTVFYSSLGFQIWHLVYNCTANVYLYHYQKYNMLTKLCL